MRIRPFLILSAALLWAGVSYAGQVPNPANITGTPANGDIMVSGGGQNITSGGGNASSIAATATGGTTSITMGNRFGHYLDVKDNGGISDAVSSTQTVSITNGTNALSVASPLFASTDVGRWVVVPGASTTATTGPVTTDAVTSAGSGYTSIPTCAVNDSGGVPGTGATCSVAMALQSATVNTGGSGCTNGTFTFLIPGPSGYGTAGTVARVTGTVSGGSLSGALTVSAPGFMTTLPSSLSAATALGAGCSVAPTLAVSFGVGVVKITAWGSAYNQATTTVSLSGGSPSVAAVLATPVVSLTSFPLVAQITGFTNSTHVTLSLNAANTVSAVSEKFLIGTDNTSAFQTAITAANALGLNLYVPRGNYFFVGSLNPGAGPLTIRGDGMEATVLYTYAGDGNPTNISLLSNIFAGSPTNLQNTLQFEDFQIHGLLDYGLTNVGGPAIQLSNYKEVDQLRLKFFQISRFGQANESIYRVKVADSECNTVMRDCMRFRSSFNVLIDHNHFIHADDDAVALHQANFIQGLGVIRDSVTVTNNEFEDAPSISIVGGRIVTVTGNTIKRCKVDGITVVRDPTEGVNPLFMVNISNNNLSDCLSRPPFAPLNAVIKVLYQQPATETGEPNFVPSVAYKNSNYIAPWWEYSNVNYTTGLEPVPPGFGLTIKANTYSRQLLDVANYSTWGYGQVLSSVGFIDPPVFGTDLQPTTILDATVNGFNEAIDDNKFANARRCITLEGSSFPFATNASLTGNFCFDTWEYGILNSAGGNGGYLTLINNTFILDPYRLSGGRTGTHGAWTNAFSGSRGVSLSSFPQIFACGNKFAELYTPTANPFTAGCPNVEMGTLSATFHGAVSINAWDASNFGIGVYAQVGALWQLEKVVADPSQNIPSQFYGAVAVHVTEASSIPTTGAFTIGDFVRAIDTGPAACGCYGWIRLTNGGSSGGSEQVLGVDWATVPISVGANLTVATLPACSSSLKGLHSSVTDASAPTFLGALTGGGSTVTPVFCNGSTWVPG